MTSARVKVDGLKWNRNCPEAELKTAATGKNAIVVGGTKGLGRAIAENLELHGAQVAVLGRSFQSSAQSKIKFVTSDMSLMKSVESSLEGNAGLFQNADIIVLTVGIITAPTRKTTKEGIEEDMAVSFLSRLAIVRKLAAWKAQGRVKPSQKVWVMGFPGAKVDPGDVNDLNAEKKYEQFPQHMRTVVGNECIVHTYKDKLSIFGLNPGLIRTGIRDNVFQGWMYPLKCIVEPLIGLFCISAKTYGKNIVKLLLSKETDGMSGLLFDQKGQEVKPNEWCETAQNVRTFTEKSIELLNKGIAAP